MPPAFNIPKSVLVVCILIIAIHAALTELVSRDTYGWVLGVFSFIPLAYDIPTNNLLHPLSPYWSPVTYGLLHADWMHVGVNVMWFVAFGSPLARRFSSLKFLIFLVLATSAGALAHYVFHMGGTVPVVGASGAVSACMGASIRFAFTPGRMRGDATNAPALSLLQSLSNRGTMIFVGIWFAVNWLFGSGVVPIPGFEGGIAWEAHMGGFLFGWLGFGWFDGNRARKA